jgi:hypothetical protein
MNTEERFGRFKDAPWFNNSGQEENVLIGGAGGISSWLTLLLTRAGFVPIVYDFDIYEIHNMGGQLCKTSDIGKPKVIALQDTVKLLCGQEIYAFNEKYTSETMTGKYVFAGFDNMEARRVMFESWEAEYGNDPEALFIDGRLLAEQIQIYCVTSGDKDVYKADALFLDSEVEEAPCTMKQTSHIAAMIASFMTAFFTNHMSNVKTKTQDRNVPYYYEYFSPIGYNIIVEEA